MKIKEVVDALERFAPLPLQEDYDNAGLQVGVTETEVSGALLCLDVNEAIIDEAVAYGCNLIVSHHPLIFRKLARITDEDYVQATVMNAIRNGITIVSMHTNMDNARGGVNFKIAGKMGLTDIDFLDKGAASGSGVIGTFRKPMPTPDFMVMLKRTFNVEYIQANFTLIREISKVAICGGAGSFLLNDAIAAEADAFVTGEMRYHEFLGHTDDIQIAVIGHYQSEQFTNEVFRDIIERECPGVKCYLTKTNTNPIMYI